MAAEAIYTEGGVVEGGGGRCGRKRGARRNSWLGDHSPAAAAARPHP